MADESDKIGQDEIERLAAQAQQSAPAGTGGGSGTIDQSEIERLLGGASPAKAPTARAAAAAAAAEEPLLPSGDVEFLLRQAQEALASVDAPRSATLPAPTLPVRWQEFGGTPPSTDCATLELIREVELDLKIELGRAQMVLEDVLKLRKGSVVALDKLAGDPVDIYVNGRLIARGEVLVMNDNFCVRVAELVAAESARAG